MPRVVPRLIAALLPLVLAVGSGCVGSPVGTSSTAIKKKTTPTATRTASPLPAGTNTLKFPSPRPSVSLDPAPKPPSPKGSPSPLASVAPVMAQPIAINPTTSGFSGATQNYMVVSVAAESPAPSYQMAISNQTSSVAQAPGGSTAYHTLSTHKDPHIAFREWDRAQLALAPKQPARYRTQAIQLSEGTERQFYVITSFDSKAYKDVQVTARLAKVGEHCYVFVDKDIDKKASDASTMAGRVLEIANTFDTKIYPTDTRLFGAEPNPGVDGDPHVVLLLSPAVGNYGTDTTLGYFSQRDEFVATPDAPPIFQHSNAQEMLYISSRIVLTGSEEDYMGTVAHEFQHMINFNQKVLIGKNRQSDDLWIDEGMAMYAIEANGYGLRTGGRVLGDHVKRYQQEPGSYSLVDWDGNPDGIGYGPVYLFMVYLADRFSESIIKDIVTSTDIGLPNVENKLKERGTDFRHVFHDWAVANFLDGRVSGVSPHYQYQSLKMTGLSGKTRLDGVTSSVLGLPSNNNWKLRPYTAQYYQLPQGVIAPKFGFTGTDTGVSTRLVLP